MIIPNLHSICKRILAMVVVLVIFLKVFIIDVYALSAAPIFGEALVEVFSGLLVGSGLYTAEEVNEMSWNDAETAINDGISSGTINPLQVVGDVSVNGIITRMNFMEWLTTSVKATSDVVTSDTFGTITNVAVKNALSNYVPVTVGNWVNTLTQEDVVETPTTDLKGYSSLKIEEYTTSTGAVMRICTYFNGYVEVSDRSDGYKFYKTYYDDGTCYRMEYKNGKLIEEKLLTDRSNTGTASSATRTILVYGDVRNSDGTSAETDDETTTEIGETADGEKVTLENVQSGEVSVDDTTLDYDKFNDEAIIDLLQQILEAMENVPVVEEDSATVDSAKEAVSDMTAELDIAELNNLQMPLGISDVFPFCLPFDFVRGMEILVAKPEVPVFKTVIDFGEINGWDLGEYPIEISFEKWEPVAIVTRWTSILLFMYSLIFISTKIVKGAGA